MPTIPMKNVVEPEQLRRATFNKKGSLDVNQTLLALNGFVFERPHYVECVECGKRARFDFTEEWSESNIETLHNLSCSFRLRSNHYLCQRAIHIEARRPKGFPSFEVDDIVRVLQMRYTPKQIKDCAFNFFCNNGAFPDYKDLLEYLHYM